FRVGIPERCQMARHLLIPRGAHWAFPPPPQGLSFTFKRGYERIMQTRTTRTWWYTMDRFESRIREHPDETLRLKCRRLLFSAVLLKARKNNSDVRRILIYDNQENAVAQQLIRSR